MKTWFITGGDGFIGFFICKELLKDPNNRIVIYDAHKHYIPLEKSDWFKYQLHRIKELGQYSDRIIRVKGDTTDRGYVSEALSKHKPDVIIHLAALPIAYVSNDYPEEARRTVLEGIITVLDVVRELKLKLDRIIYTSSSMVYGDFLRDESGSIIPAKEDQICLPIDMYGSMKLAGEHIVRAYAKRFKIPYTIIRPSAVYGPTDCNQRVTELFLKSALQGKDVILDNGGLHQLDFSYVEDVAHGFVLAANSANALNETFNITCGQGRTIKELGEVMKTLIPSTNLVVEQVDVYRPNRGALDISKARRLLGYEPKHSLEVGMAKYLDFVRNFKD